MEASLKLQKPTLHEKSFVAEGVCLIGAVTLKEGASVWYNSVLRADLEPIVIGENSNIQDGSVIHVDQGQPTIVGRNVTVGHGVVLHACTIEDDSLVGTGAIVLDGAVIRRRSLLGAGSVVPPRKSFPEGSLILGSPAKVARMLSAEEIEKIAEAARQYRMFWEAYLEKGITAFRK